MFYNETLQKYYYSVDDAPTVFKKFPKLKAVGNKTRKYYDISASFDIETTSFYDKDEKVAIMYIWQFGITNDALNETCVFIGRTWEEFIKLLEIIKVMFHIKDTKACEYAMPIYIHNLAFEFTFMRPIFQTMIKDVFSVKSNTPLYFRIPSFEFRCSYLLSGLRLQDLPTKQHKLSGDLDYDKVRHSETEMTDKEIAYCMMDVLVLCEYISQKREQDGNVFKIPMTKTGYVRRELIKHCLGEEFRSKKQTAYIKKIKDLKFINPREYIVLKGAYQGGHTAACSWYVDKLIDNVECYDFSSSYPSTMVCEPRFPIGHQTYFDDMNEDLYMDYINNGYAIVCEATYTNIHSKMSYDAWIPSSKSEFECVVDLNNGKIDSAEGEVTLLITELDYKIYKMFYDYDKVTFKFCYIYKTAYLPKEVIEYVLKLYSDKTELKGVKEKKLLYSKLKELLNSLYGMSVTDICKATLEYDTATGVYSKEDMSIESITEKVKQYNRKIDSGKIATPYIWGVYISALARFNLATGIYFCGERGLWVYADTDSIYVKKSKEVKDFVDRYNKMVEHKMNSMCEHYGFDKNIWKPKNIDGEEKPLGFWDHEGLFKRFKTLGAKRYIKETDKGGLEITVAGLGKKQGADYLIKKWGEHGKCSTAVFDNFNNGLAIPKGETGKSTHTIILNESCGEITDYLGKTAKYISKGGTHLEPTSFNLSMSKLYLDFLCNIDEEYMF